VRAGFRPRAPGWRECRPIAGRKIPAWRRPPLWFEPALPRCLPP